MLLTSYVGLYEPDHSVKGGKNLFVGQIAGGAEELWTKSRNALVLGGWAFGTLKEFGKHTRLKEEPGEYPDVRRMLSNLLADDESPIRELRADVANAGTDNFLTELMERHEKMAWMLRAFLGGESV